MNPYAIAPKKSIGECQRNEDDAVQSRTLANIVEREGALIQEHIGKKAEDIMKSHGFDA